MRPDLNVGTALPDYELPDYNGGPRRPSEIQHEDPMVDAGDAAAHHVGWDLAAIAPLGVPEQPVAAHLKQR
jgi:hypothetical protein